MTWWTRLFGSGTPEDVTALVPPDEEVHAWARDHDGAPVAATSLALYVAGRRVPWHEVNKATWRPDRLTVVPASEPEPGVVVDAAPVTVRLAEPGDLPAEVRARVTRSVAFSEHHRLPDGGGVRVVARRVAGRDGLQWRTRFDAGTDTTDPGVRAAASRLLDQSRVLLEEAV